MSVIFSKDLTSHLLTSSWSFTAHPKVSLRCCWAACPAKRSVVSVHPLALVVCSLWCLSALLMTLSSLCPHYHLASVCCDCFSFLLTAPELLSNRSSLSKGFLGCNRHVAHGPGDKPLQRSGPSQHSSFLCSVLHLGYASRTVSGLELRKPGRKHLVCNAF